MQAISVVIITFNEERNIGRCLESVKDLSDDIIVIDSYSNDRTEEICKLYNVRFIPFSWKGYSDTKNYGNSLAVNDYIFSVDADEAPSEDLKQSIIEEMKNPTCDAYFMNRMTNYCGRWIRHTDWYPDKKLRVWNRKKGQWDGKVIHEDVNMLENSSIGYLKGDLYHYSYYTIAEHIAQTNKFTDFAAEMRYDKGKKAGFVKLFGSPLWKFIKSYIVRLGFLDGFAGFAVCVISSHATFLTYAKLRQIIIEKEIKEKESSQVR